MEVSGQLQAVPLSSQQKRHPVPVEEESAWALGVGLNDLENGTQIVKLIAWTVLRGRRV
jgi:hypothetical protein